MQIIRTLHELQAICKPYEWIGYDLETNSLDPRKGQILLASMTTPDSTYVIDIITLGLKAYEYLKIPLTQSDLVINHNITFDYKWTLHHTGIEIENMSDVMINEQVLTAGLFVQGLEGKPFSLNSIAYRRLGIKLKKDIRKEFIDHVAGTPLSDEAYEYAGEDTQILRAIYDQQVQEIQEKGLDQVFGLECSLIPVTAYMELTGILVDTDTLATFREPIERYIKKCDQMLQDAFIANGAADTIYFYKDGYRCINTSSRDQKLKALNAVGVNVDALDSKTLVRWDFRNRKKKTSQIEYEQLLDEDDQDIGDAIEKFGGYENKYLRALAFYTGAEKLLSAYVNGIIEKTDTETNRFYPWYRQCGARSTGRYSGNIQQIPKNDKLKRLGLDLSIRECFIAPKGRKLIIADFSAIELVILADRSNDERLAYEHVHGDVHTIVCNEVLAKFIPLAGEVTKKNAKQHPYKIIRDFSKVFSYGIAYGVTGKALADQAMEKLGALNIVFTPDQGDEGIELWYKAFPVAGQFLKESARMAVTLGYTDSIWGRKRWFDLDGMKNNKWRYLAAQREGSNQRIQSTSADMTKLAMLYCFNMLDRNKARIIMSVHDEIVLEAKDSYVDQAARILKSSMETAARDILKNLGHTVEIFPQVSTRYDK